MCKRFGGAAPNVQGVQSAQPPWMRGVRGAVSPEYILGAEGQRSLGSLNITVTCITTYVVCGNLVVTYKTPSKQHISLCPNPYST